MTDETTAPSGGEAVELPADAPASFESPEEAASYFMTLAGKRAQPSEPVKDIPAESAKPATAETESAQADSDPETAPAEVPEEAEPAGEPPIEPPRSWTKADKEEFQTYPREAQEKILRAVTRQDTEFRRSQNEIAETRKAVEVERVAAEKARQQYEANLPALMQSLQDAQQSAFADIRTVDDVTKLANEDPFRYLQWQAHQTKLQAVNAERLHADEAKTSRRQSERTAYEAQQNARLIELVPEMADPKKASELRDRAIKMLNDDLELSTQQLTQWMADDTGHQILSNAGIQKLMADGLKYRDIVNAPKAVAKSNLPPVQRPGTSRPAGSDVSEREQALNRKSDLTVREATELYTIQQSRQRRAS